MPPNSASCIPSSAIPTVKSHQKSKAGSAQPLFKKVERYVDELKRERCPVLVDHAFSRLTGLDIPIQILEMFKVRSVVSKQYAHKVGYFYQVNKLLKRIDWLHRKEEQKNTQKKVRFAEIEEEEYDPEYPKIRSSVEMNNYKLLKNSSLLSQYVPYIPTPLSL